jgi:hypothetical protein
VDEAAVGLCHHVSKQHKSAVKLTAQPTAEGWSNVLQVKCTVKPGWLITGRAGQDWNTRGKWIGVVGTKNDDWQEPAKQGHEQWIDADEDTYNDDADETALGCLRTLLGEDTAGEKLGIVFKEKLSGKTVDSWPCVRRIDPGSLIKEATPQLRVGCKLISINGESIEDMAFKEVIQKGLIQVRPLELIWQDLLVVADISSEGDLGVVFQDAWPNIKKIKHDGLAGSVEGLTVGCKLLSINGISVEGMELRQVGPLVGPRPVKLVFSQPRADGAQQLRASKTPRGKTRSAPETFVVDRLPGTIPVEPEPQDASDGGGATPRAMVSDEELTS